MKFKVDENLPTEVAELLRRQGHDAWSVADQRLAGHPDGDVARVCHLEGRALVTLDRDFSDIRAYPPEDYAGIIVLRPSSQAIRLVTRLMERSLALLHSEPLVGCLWIVEDHRLRIRGTRPRTTS